MNQRLVWNFEINNDQPLIIPTPLPTEAHTDRWEARFFWPDNTPILLNGLDDTFLELSRYKAKHRQDTYCLLPDTDENIKVRRNQLLYKPLIMKSPLAIAYGKKINLEDVGDEHGLIQRVQQKGRRIDVEKEALIYRFETEPTTKLELARLRVSNTTWFSINIESRSKFLVESIAQHIVTRHDPCDYVTFLNWTLK